MASSGHRRNLPFSSSHLILFHPLPGRSSSTNKFVEPNTAVFGIKKHIFLY